MTNGLKNSDGRLGEFERQLTGGFEHGKLMFLKNSDPSIGTELVLFMMDAEYDPVRITYDLEGLINIHADEHKWHCFTPDQLQIICDLADKAEDMWEAWIENNKDDDE